MTNTVFHAKNCTVLFVNPDYFVLFGFFTEKLHEHFEVLWLSKI